MDAFATFPPTGPVRAVPPAVTAGDPAVVGKTNAAAPSQPRTVGVEWSQRPDGVQVMTFIDRRTGVVISQTPARQVLAVVDAIVAVIQQREG